MKKVKVKGKVKGKGKGKRRKRWGPRNKGPKRSQSRTRGYASNTSGRQIYTDKIPFLKSHLNDTCQKCNHKTAAGEPVHPHRLGDLICPEVQAGRVGCHPRWIKFKDQYPNVKWYSPADKGK